MEKQQTIKIWLETLKKLRMLYALTGKSMTQILDELVTAELQRLEKK
jgi:predicted DNA-binding protein